MVIFDDGNQFTPQASLGLKYGCVDETSLSRWTDRKHRAYCSFSLAMVASLYILNKD